MGIDDQEDDGLSLPWYGVVFVNPPYGRTLPVGARRLGNPARDNSGSRSSLARRLAGELKAKTRRAV